MRGTLQQCHHLSHFSTTEDHPAYVIVDVVSSIGALAESSDDEEILDEEMVHSYKVIHEKLLKSLSENQDLRMQVFLLGNEKEDLDKQCNML